MPTKYKGTPEEQRALSAFIVLTRSLESVMGRIKEAGGDPSQTGLTYSQFGVLETLLHVGPMCQRDVSRKILKSTSNLTTVIDNLVKEKLVKRVPDPNDRRSHTLHLTPAGEKRIKKVFPAHAKAMAQAMGVLQAGELKSLRTLCKKLGMAGK
jgi:MarR family 2-MHQ and catechol resistance regulon transcriptional repressor